MADTSIEWTDKVWNPIVGCSIVSPGCTNCYAMKMAGRWRAKTDSIYYGLTIPTNGGSVWSGKLALQSNVLTKPLEWKKPQKIFVNSMGDLFHEDAPDEWIDRVFAVMALAPQHTFQVLTKRSKRMREYVSAAASLSRNIGGAAVSILEEYESVVSGGVKTTYPARAAARRDEIIERCYASLPNVWLGVSCEDQRRADERVPVLLATPAAVRFVSAEPLLGPIDFTNVRFGWSNKEVRGSALTGYSHPNAAGYGTVHERLDWIIAGGESGPRSRPMAVQWAKDILAQCQNAGVACFVKQLSGPGGRAIKDMAQFPESLRVREFPLPSSTAGREG